MKLSEYISGYTSLLWHSLLGWEGVNFSHFPQTPISYLWRCKYDI